MKKTTLTFCLLATVLLFSCKKDADSLPLAEDAQMARAGRNIESELPAISFYALAEGNRLDQYSIANADQVQRSITITGLQGGERLLSIDFRPATGQLYALGSSSRLYTINLQNGMARTVGAGPFSPALSGTMASLDFNPTVDRIRVVTNTGQNLRLHPELGTVVATDGNINGAPGAVITAVAYTENFAGTTATTLYDIDVANNMLYKQDPPNDGRLVPVGRFNGNLNGEGGFDIAPPTAGGTNVALALFRQNKKSTLYSVDLATARLTKIEKFDKGDDYYGIAIPTNPVAYAVSMGSLLLFNPMMPSTTIAKTITGLESGETILGIDFRPSNGALYALGSNSRLYTINTANGAATFVASLTVPLNGTAFGFDFNPVPDLLRIVSNTGQNLRVVPATGFANEDGAINGADNAMITAAAYTNNFAGTTTTALYVVNTADNKLYLQSPPNNGTLTDGKPLGTSFSASNGFDVGGSSNMAYGLFTSGGQTRLYAVDLMTGMATPTGEFNSSVSGFAIGLGF